MYSLSGETEVNVLRRIEEQNNKFLKIFDKIEKQIENQNDSLSLITLICDNNQKVMLRYLYPSYIELLLQLFMMLSIFNITFIGRFYYDNWELFFGILPMIIAVLTFSYKIYLKYINYQNREEKEDV